MRKIKFRAWDVLEEEMINNVSVHENSLIIKIDTDTSVLTEFVPRFNEQWFKVMQYTGLKDKNGREIYEGDILEIKHLMGCETGELIFKYGAFLFDDGGYSYLGDHLANSEYIKVIGNIYENPELLEGEE